MDLGRVTILIDNSSYRSNNTDRPGRARPTPRHGGAAGRRHADHAPAPPPNAGPANPNGRTNADVLKPWVNGMALTRRPAGKWIVDFGLKMSAEDAALYEEPFRWVKEHVYPMRQENRIEAHCLDWWRRERDPHPSRRRRRTHGSGDPQARCRHACRATRSLFSRGEYKLERAGPQSEKSCRLSWRKHDPGNRSLLGGLDRRTRGRQKVFVAVVY